MNWLWYVAHKMHHLACNMYDALFHGFPELLNANCLSSSIKLNQADGEFHLEPYLLICSDTTDHSLQLMYYAVCMSHATHDSFSHTIGQMDPNFHTLLQVHVCLQLNLYFNRLNTMASILVNMLPVPVTFGLTWCNRCRSHYCKIVSEGGI